MNAQRIIGYIHTSGKKTTGKTALVDALGEL